MAKIGAIGQVPNHTLFQGALKYGTVPGVVTSEWDQQQITALANNCKEDELHYRIRGGKVWTITIEFPLDIVADGIGNEPNPITFWEFKNTLWNQDIFEMGNKLFVSKLASSTKRRIEDNLRNLQSPRLPVGDDDAGNLVNATTAFNLKFLQTSRLFPAKSLQRQAIMSNNFDLTTLPVWDTSQFDLKVFTTQELKKQYSTPTKILGVAGTDIPKYIQDQMPVTAAAYDVTANNIANRQGYVMSKDGLVFFIGWLQYPIDTQQITPTKLNVTQQFVFNQWSCGPYGIYDAFNGSPGPDPTQTVINAQANQFPP